MECDKCGEPAAVHQAYSGLHLCRDHLCRSVEKRVRRRIREDGLLSRTATPEDPERWVIGLSGGKDSVVLTTILAETFASDPRVELVALSIHEGIEGYRDESLAASESLTEALDVEHETVSYESEFDVRMDDVVEDDPEDMAACAYCGVFRRDLLSRYAEALDADKLLTGHNLDDEAQTALMNFLEGDLRQMAKHFEASLGPFETDGEGPTDRARQDQDHHVPRAKPLRDVPEKEIALVARFRDLPAHITECPRAAPAYRGEIREVLLGLEENHPGTRHSIIAGYEDIAALAAGTFDGDPDEDFGVCDRCNTPTPRDLCRKCDLLEALEAV